MNRAAAVGEAFQAVARRNQLSGEVFSGALVEPYDVLAM
jgi:hypothetical protein